MLLGLVFGFVFAAIGVTVIGHLWTTRGFGEPPLVAKIFGTLVAIPFMAVGVTLFTSALRGQGPGGGEGAGSSSTPPGTGVGYTCPGCGNRLGEDADVSPKGDVKCGYCRRWFNIHSA
jgi:hypothetical protein